MVEEVVVVVVEEVDEMVEEVDVMVDHSTSVVQPVSGSKVRHDGNSHVPFTLCDISRCPSSPLSDDNTDIHVPCFSGSSAAL